MPKVVTVFLFAAAMLACSAPFAAEPPGTVKRGDIAPDFTLMDEQGRSHTLSAERGKRPVVLVFYRGHW